MMPTTLQLAPPFVRVAKLAGIAIAVIAAAVLLFVVDSREARADTEIKHWGETGDHSLDPDSYNIPGASCGASFITVEAPYMKGSHYIFDQKVTWKAVVQKYNKKKKKWPTVRISDPVVGYTDSSRDAFEDSGTWTQISDLNPGRYRVNVQMNWYKPFDENTLEGSATHRVNYYKDMRDYTVKQNSCTITGGLVGSA
jgi:hypothetical protein